MSLRWPGFICIAFTLVGCEGFHSSEKTLAEDQLSTATPPHMSLEINGFSLIRSSTNEVIQPLRPDDVLDLHLLGTDIIIQAHVGSDVASVAFSLADISSVDNTAPFQVAVPGNSSSYQLSAKGYKKIDARGPSGDSSLLSFKVSGDSTTSPPSINDPAEPVIPDEPKDPNAPISGVSVYDNSLWVDGERFFPFGGYWIQPVGITNVERVAAVDAAAGMGWNLLHTEAYYAVETDPIMNRAKHHGMYVGLQGSFDGIHDDMISRYANHPNLLYWQLGDDANYLYSETEVQQRYREIHALDPNHPKWIVTSTAADNTSTMNIYVDEAELQGWYYYVMPLEPMRFVYEGHRNHVALAEAAGTVSIGVIQAYAWPGQRPPTVGEMRHMTYAAIAAGVKGIVYYTLEDYEFSLLDDASHLANAMAGISNEVLNLQRFWLDGKRAYLRTGSADVQATRWTLGDEEIILVVNTSTQERTYSVDNVDQASDFGGSGGSFFADGQLNGKIPGYGVQRIRVSP